MAVGAERAQVNRDVHARAAAHALGEKVVDVDGPNPLAPGTAAGEAES